MSNFPEKDKRAKTGSSLRGQPLLAQRQAAFTKELRAHEQLVRDYRRESKNILSKADLRKAGKISREVNAGWRKLSMNIGGDSLKMDALKSSARGKLQRQFVRALPNYRKWQVLQRSHLAGHRTLDDAALAALPNDRVNVAWGDLPVLESDAQVFAPPFSVQDVQSLQNGNFIRNDQSFARPAIGHLVNNFVFDQDEHTNVSDGLWGLLTIGNARSWASCGIAFTMPKAGRLQVSAVLQSFYNKLVFSVQDNFGFSSADVAITVRLFIDIVRGSQLIDLPTAILTTGLTSHGSDLSYSMSDLDTTTPYTVSAETTESFDANESVQILVGSEVSIGTVIDDMHCHVNSVLWWALNKISVDVI